MNRRNVKILVLSIASFLACNVLYAKDHAKPIKLKNVTISRKKGNRKYDVSITNVTALSREEVKALNVLWKAVPNNPEVRNEFRSYSKIIYQMAEHPPIAPTCIPEDIGRPDWQISADIRKRHLDYLDNFAGDFLNTYRKYLKLCKEIKKGNTDTALLGKVLQARDTLIEKSSTESFAKAKKILGYQRLLD